MYKQSSLISFHTGVIELEKLSIAGYANNTKRRIRCVNKWQPTVLQAGPQTDDSWSSMTLLSCCVWTVQSKMDYWCAGAELLYQQHSNLKCWIEFTLLNVPDSPYDGWDFPNNWRRWWSVAQSVVKYRPKGLNHWYHLVYLNFRGRKMGQICSRSRAHIFLLLITTLVSLRFSSSIAQLLVKSLCISKAFSLDMEFLRS